MSFTIATAITRLTGGTTNLLYGTNGAYSSGQQLQRINEVLERFYDQGTWRGLHDTVSLTTTTGIITLSASYQRLDGLGIPNENTIVPIKSQQWTFSNSGPMPQDWTAYSGLVAIDLGESAGQRRYQVTGDTTSTDTKTFSGLARKRYVWATDTATVVVPDSYHALRLGVIAMKAEDEGQENDYRSKWALALEALNGNLQEYEVEDKRITASVTLGMGGLENLH